MRLTVSFRECLCVALAVASLPNTASGATNDTANVATQCHCAGIPQLKGNTNLVALNKILALPTTVAFRKLFLQRVCRMLAEGLNLGTNASAASLVEPLLSDVLETESLGSFGGSAASPLSFVLALRLDAKEAQLWQDNLAKALSGAGEKFAVEEFNGWRWNKGASNSLWIVPARGWLLAGRGDEFLPLQVEYLQQVKRQGRPAPPLQDNWLEAEMDWARLAAWLPDWSRLLKPARIKISVTAETNHLRTTARVIYPEAIPWKSDSWQIPTELVRSPLISFTAGQNIAAFLNLNPLFSRIGGSLLTNQFYAWALGEMPLQSYMAWPVADADKALEEWSTEAPPAFNADLEQFNGSELVWQADLRRLYLSKLGMISPDLTAALDHGGKFLLSTLFPLLPNNPPAPDELLKQINGRTNLVYYDWEITGPRLQEWRLLGRILLTRRGVKTHDMAVARGIEDKWMGGLRPLVGNTVTEITRVAPNELSVVRNSPVGFTGIEIFLLSDWLSTAGSAPVDSQSPAPETRGSVPLPP